MDQEPALTWSEGYLLHLLRSPHGTKCGCRDVRYSAALGGLAEVTPMGVRGCRH